MSFTPQTYHFQYCHLMLEGGKKYQIKGCAGQGGFAQVFKAHLDSNPDEVVALKVVAYAFLGSIILSLSLIFLIGCWDFELKMRNSCRYKSLASLGNFTCIGNLT